MPRNATRTPQPESGRPPGNPAVWLTTPGATCSARPLCLGSGPSSVQFNRDFNMALHIVSRCWSLCLLAVLSGCVSAEKYETALRRAETAETRAANAEVRSVNAEVRSAEAEKRAALAEVRAVCAEERVTAELTQRVIVAESKAAVADCEREAAENRAKKAERWFVIAMCLLGITIGLAVIERVRWLCVTDSYKEL